MAKKISKKDLEIKRLRQEATRQKRIKRVKYDKKSDERIAQERFIDKIFMVREMVDYPFEQSRKELLKYDIKDLQNHLKKLWEKKEKGIRYG